MLENKRTGLLQKQKASVLDFKLRHGSTKLASPQQCVMESDVQASRTQTAQHCFVFTGTDCVPSLSVAQMTLKAWSQLVTVGRLMPASAARVVLRNAYAAWNFSLTPPN